MARYRKVDVRMRSDAKFRALSAPAPNGQDCWIYLLTNRYTTNIPGVYAAFSETLARDLGWHPEGFLKAFREVSEKGMALADWDVGLVYVPNAITYDPPQSVNVVKSWQSHIDELPECDLKYKALAGVGDFMKGMPEAFREAFSKLSVKACRIQEQEQEQDQDPERESARELADLWRAWRFAGLPDMANPQEMARLHGLLAPGKLDFVGFCVSFKTVTDHWRANGAPSCGASPTLAIDKADIVELHIRGEYPLRTRRDAKSGGQRFKNFMIETRPAVTDAEAGEEDLSALLARKP